MKFNILSFEMNAYEKKGLLIKRPYGKDSYVFIRFKSPIYLQDKYSAEERKSGSCILYSPNSYQMYSSPNHDLLHDYMTFTVSDNSFFKKIQFQTDTAFYPEQPAFIDEILKTIKYEIHLSSVVQQEMINSALTNMFVQITRSYKNKEDLNEKSFFLLREDVKKNPQEYTVKIMAEKLHFSLSYFSTKYKFLFKVSPMEDLAQAKIDLAKQMLNEGATPFEAANFLNFDSLPNFYKWFKLKTKLTPKAFIERNKGQSNAKNKR